MLSRIFAVAAFAAALAHSQYSGTVTFDPYACALFQSDSSKSAVVVHLRGGETLRGRSTLCRTIRIFLENPAFRIKLEDDRVIHPKDTDSIVFAGSTGIPAPNGLEWAFKIIDGKISVYSPKPALSFRSATWLSKNSDALVKYSLKKLEDHMGDHPKAVGLVRRRRNVGYAVAAMVGAGVGLIFTGLITGMDEVPVEGSLVDDTKLEFNPNVFFFAGIALVATSWVPSAITSNNARHALALYNGSSE